MFDKKGQTGTNKLIGIILIVFVLAVVFFFIFMADIPGYFNLFPGFSDPSDSGYIRTDEASITQCIQAGKIMAPESLRSIPLIGKKQQFIYVNEENTNLYWTGEMLKLRTPVFSTDVIAGDITNLGIIVIRDVFLNESSAEYRSYEKYLPPLSVLEYLNNAYLIPGNILCKGHSNE